MAILKSRSKQTTVIDGASMESAHELGVLFGCHSGLCGKCATRVVSGLNNLSDPTDEEKAKDLEPSRRLMCQCRITRGTVALDLD